jgi:hypothetical protein
MNSLAFRLSRFVDGQTTLIGSLVASNLPSWNDTKRLLLTWADDLDQEANEAERAKGSM